MDDGDSIDVARKMALMDEGVCEQEMQFGRSEEEKEA